jgi:hypothetical protein
LFLKQAALFVGRTIISEKHNSLTRARRRIVKLSIKLGGTMKRILMSNGMKPFPAYSAASTHATEGRSMHLLKTTFGLSP